MNDRTGNGTGGFEVKIRTNTAKFTNMIIARVGLLTLTLTLVGLGRQVAVFDVLRR